MEATVQGLMQSHFDNYAKTHRMPLWQYKAARLLMRCGTASMGAHTEHCPSGDYEALVYHSCRHRSCPRCNGKSKAEWLDGVSSRLLPCDHFHVILTLPHELVPLWRYNREWFHEQLFINASESLRVLLRDARFLGAEPGMLLALHTWGRTLNEHPHIHALVSAGGLNNGTWRSNDKGYLMPVEVLRTMYRGKWLGALSRALDSKRLALPPDWSKGYARGVFRKLAGQKWNVRIERRYTHGKGVAIYLSRYVRGGAVANSRLTRMDHERVWLRYWDHEAKRNDTVALSRDNFMRRILSHVPVPARHMVRYYGLYVPKARDKRALAREALGAVAPETPPEKAASERRCPECGGPLKRIPVTRTFEISYKDVSPHGSVQPAVRTAGFSGLSPPPQGTDIFLPRGRPFN